MLQEGNHKPVGAGCPHMSKEKQEWKKRSLAEQTALAGSQEGEKRRVYDLWKKGQASQADYKDILKLYREKIRRVKAQGELVSDTTIKDNQNVPLNTLTTKEDLKRISILYWMQEEK